MTAQTLARERQSEGDEGIREITARNVEKVTRFREGGMDALEAEVKRLEAHEEKSASRERKAEGSAEEG